MLDLSKIDFSNLPETPKRHADGEAWPEHAFESGAQYNAIIAGIVPCVNINEKFNKTQDGFALLLQVENDREEIVWKGSDFYSMSGNYLYNLAKFAKLISNLLKCTNNEDSIKKAMAAAGINGPLQLLEMPVVVTMTTHEYEGKTYAYIKDISAPSKRMPGLESADINIKLPDLTKARLLKKSLQCDYTSASYAKGVEAPKYAANPAPAQESTDDFDSVIF